MRVSPTLRVAAVCLVGAVLLVFTAPHDARAGEVVAPGDDTVLVGAFEAEREYRSYLSSDPGPEMRLVEYQRTGNCLYPPGGSSRPCPQPDPSAPPLSLVCEAGAPVAPLWRNRRESPSAGWQGWVMRTGWACPEDLLPVFTQEDLRALKIEPLAVNQQPRGGPILIHKPTIVYAEPADREFRVVLFDTYGVDVVVTPVEYNWDFGDGASLVTTKPGRPYPDFDLTHTYTAASRVAITLTTTWAGKYRVDDDPLHRWLDVEGTAMTVDVGEEFDVVELRSLLVGDWDPGSVVSRRARVRSSARADGVRLEPRSDRVEGAVVVTRDLPDVGVTLDGVDDQAVPLIA